MELTTSKCTGIQTAWLLSTIGLKATSRVTKKDVLKYSISQICTEITNGDMSIRYLSNILHGVALLYKYQINYLINDLEVIKTKLLRDSSAVVSKDAVGLGCAPVTLANDPYFNISVDLVPPWESFGSQQLKRRKLEIHKLDQLAFPVERASHPDRAHQSDLEYERILENYMERELNIHDYSLAETSRDLLEIDFNNSIIQDHTEIEIEIDDLNDIPIHDDELLQSGTNQITNDPNFYLSTELGSALHALPEISPRNTVSLRYQNVVIDRTPLKLSSWDIAQSWEQYQQQLEITRITKHHVDEVIKDHDKGCSLFTRFVNSVVLGKRFPDVTNRTNNTTMAISKELEHMRILERMDIPDGELETAREVLPRNLDLGMFDREDFIEINLEGDNIFDLSFGGFDQSYIRSQNISRETDGRPRILLDPSSDSESVTSQSFYAEESIDYTPGAPKLPTQRIRLNLQLVQFYKFLKQKGGTCGKACYEESINLTLLQPLNALSQEVMSREYVQLLFSEITSSDQGKPVTRRLAAKSFISLLSLASRNFVAIGDNRDPNGAAGHNFKVIVGI